MVENVMTGDWVQFLSGGNLYQKRVTGIQDNGEFIQAEETDTYYVKSIYKPIPFTPEIIEKNRFRFNKEESDLLSEMCKRKILAYDFPKILGNRFLVEYDTQEKVAYLTDHSYIPIRYAHEFQHLLRLMEKKAPEVKEVDLEKEKDTLIQEIEELKDNSKYSDMYDCGFRDGSLSTILNIIEIIKKFKSE